MGGQEAGGEDPSEAVPGSPPFLPWRAFLVRVRSHLTQRQVKGGLGTAQGSFKRTVTEDFVKWQARVQNTQCADLEFGRRSRCSWCPVGVPVLYARSQESAELCQRASGPQRGAGLA